MKFLLAFLYMGFIFIISVIKTPDGVDPFTGFDKVVHFVMYAIMGILWARIFLGRRHSKELSRVFTKIILITFLYGLFVEFVQLFTPSREASFFDAIANGAGGAAGASVYYCVHRYMCRRLRRDYDT